MPGDFDTVKERIDLVALINESGVPLIVAEILPWLQEAIANYVQICVYPKSMDRSIYEKQFGSVPATFGANTWDAGILLERAIPAALKVAKPGTEAFRTALRDALEQQRQVVGCQGVFNMSPTNHNGMDERARVLVTVNDGKFRLLPE